MEGGLKIMILDFRIVSNRLLYVSFRPRPESWENSMKGAVRSVTDVGFINPANVVYSDHCPDHN